jgi:hypothetical protein
VVKEGGLEGDVWGRNRKGREGGGGKRKEGRWRDRMRWDGDEAQARAEDGIILLLLAAAATLSPTPTHRHLFGSPALPWLLNISSPFLSLFFLSITLVLFPDSPCTPHLAVCMSWNPPIATPIEIPDRGKFDQILCTHGLSNYPSFILIY